MHDSFNDKILIVLKNIFNKNEKTQSIYSYISSSFIFSYNRSAAISYFVHSIEL